MVFKDLFSFILGRRQYNLYFQNIKISHSLFSIILAFFSPIDFFFKGKSKLKKSIQKMYNFKKFYTFNSARSSLYALLKCLEFPKNSEVLVTGFTCEAVPNAVINAGYTPIYIDINRHDFCMNASLIKKKITKNTKLIIIQHTFGIPAEIEKIIKIARQHNLYIVEDCAVSFGSKSNGVLTGKFGDAAIFSFELSKTFTSCWGGMLTLNNDNQGIIKKIDTFYLNVPHQSKKETFLNLYQLGLSGILYHNRIFIIGKYLIAILFKLKIFKSSTSTIEKQGGLSPDYLRRLSNGQALILEKQIKTFQCYKNRNLEIKSKIISILGENLISKQRDLFVKDDVLLIRFPFLVKNKDLVMKRFQKYFFEVGTWFSAPLSSQNINHETFKYKKGSCKISEKVCAEIINLPIIDNDEYFKLLDFEP